jgi:hypothetical protein
LKIISSKQEEKEEKPPMKSNETRGSFHVEQVGYQVATDWIPSRYIRHRCLRRSWITDLPIEESIRMFPDLRSHAGRPSEIRFCHACVVRAFKACAWRKREKSAWIVDHATCHEWNQSILQVTIHSVCTTYHNNYSMVCFERLV